MVISQKMSENKMEYRGSKSDNLSVKEQRVDGSLCSSIKYIRCTLMGIERNYQVNILSKQLKKLNYSTLNNKSKLNP
jgi:hypothetical protein